MALVKFLRDFQGWATAGQFYQAGDTADLPDQLAQMCVDEQAAELVSDVESTTPLPETPTPKKIGRPKKAAK